MFRVAILDDEPQYVDVIADVVNFYNREYQCIYEVHKYISSFQFVDDIDSGVQFDICLLDIEMPNVSGMELAAKLCRQPKTFIVFITAYKEYAIDGYKYGVFRYIHKQDLKQELILALRDIAKRVARETGNYMLVRTPKYDGKVYFRDIIYLYKRAKDAVFVMDGAFRELKVRRTLTDIYKELPRNEFFYADRCYIVNLRHIDSVETQMRKLCLKNGDKVTISQSHMQEVKDLLARYWGENL